MSSYVDMTEILAGGAPWEIQALCVECGKEHTAFTFSPKTRDLKDPPRFGTCQVCIDAEQERLDAMGWEIEEPAKKETPSLEELQEKLDKEEQRDAFEPW